MTISVAVVTISDSAASGHRVDTSGDTARRIAGEMGWHVHTSCIIPDEIDIIMRTLQQFVHSKDIQCVLTTGGTGLGPRDVTPEATLAIIERTVPGMAEAMRAATLPKTKFAMLSRQVVGAAKETLIVNLPGSPKAVEECLAVVCPVIPHAIALLAGDTQHK